MKEFLIEYENEICSEFGNESWFREREERSFEKARKIPESEYNGPVFDDDTFYYSVEEFYDMWVCDGNDEDEDMELPKFLTSSEERRTIRPEDLDHAIENIMENVELDELPEYHIPQYLRDAWDKFCEEESSTYYMRDDDEVVILEGLKNE